MKEVKVEEIMSIIEEVLVEIYNSEYDEIRARVELLLKSKKQIQYSKIDTETGFQGQNIGDGMSGFRG